MDFLISVSGAINTAEITWTGYVLSMCVVFYVILLLLRRLWHRRKTRLTKNAEAVARNELCLLVPLMYSRISTFSQEEGSNPSSPLRDEGVHPLHRMSSIRSRQHSLWQNDSASPFLGLAIRNRIAQEGGSQASRTSSIQFPIPIVPPDACPEPTRGMGRRSDFLQLSPPRQPPILRHIVLLSELFRLQLLTPSENESAEARAADALKKRTCCLSANSARRLVHRAYRSQYEEYRLAILREFIAFAVASRSVTVDQTEEARHDE